MRISYEAHGSTDSKEIYIPFQPPLKSYDDVKPRLLALKLDAEDALGMVRSFTPSPPRTSHHDMSTRRANRQYPPSASPPHVPSTPLSPSSSSSLVSPPPQTTSPWANSAPHAAGHAPSYGPGWALRSCMSQRRAILRGFVRNTVRLFWSGYVFFLLSFSVWLVYGID